MSYRIVHALKRFAFTAALRVMPAGRFAPSEPEPVRRDATPAQRDMADDWMFDNPASSVSPEVKALSGELSRMSGALGELRAVLAAMADHAPIETVAEVNERAPANYTWAEDMLFDGEMAEPPALPELSIKGEAAFLFEEEPAPRRWAVLEPSLIHATPAA